MTQDDEQGRHDEQGADGRDGDDTDPGIAERAQEVLREHQERPERGGDGRGGERDRSSRGGHCAPDGVVHARPCRELFPESADHQQGVVDAEAEAQCRGQVDREDGDIGDAAEDEELRERARDGDGSDGQRQQRRDHAAEDDQEQYEGERYGDGLGQDKILAGLLPHLARHGGAATGPDRECAFVRSGVGVDDSLGVLVPLRAVAPHMGEHQGLAAVLGTEVGTGRVPVRDHVPQVPFLLEVGHQGQAAAPGRRGVDTTLGRPDQQDQVRLPAELLVDDLRGAAGRGGRIVVAAPSNLPKAPAPAAPMRATATTATTSTSRDRRITKSAMRSNTHDLLCVPT